MFHALVVLVLKTSENDLNCPSELDLVDGPGSLTHSVSTYSSVR